MASLMVSNVGEFNLNTHFQTVFASSRLMVVRDYVFIGREGSFSERGLSVPSGNHSSNRLSLRLVAVW